MCSIQLTYRDGKNVQKFENVQTNEISMTSNGKHKYIKIHYKYTKNAKKNT